MKECTFCHTLNNDCARYCVTCGSVISKDCPACHTVNEPTAKFCTKCGVALDSSNPSPKKKGKYTVLTIFLLFLFFPVGLYFMWARTSWNKAVKIIISAFFAFAAIIALIGDSDTGASDATGMLESSSIVAPEVTSDSQETSYMTAAETTSQPEDTTVEPQVTTSIPENTTSEPSITTSVPEDTTSEPSMTTSVPDITTNTPPVTTAASPETTYAAIETTSEPPVTTTEPETTEYKGISVTYITYPARSNAYAILKIKGKPNTEYKISVYYKTKPSVAKGLEAKTSGSDGSVSWNWLVGGNVQTGEYKITITGGGEKFSTYLKVE